MDFSKLTAGLNADLQDVVNTLAAGGYEVCGIKPAGWIDSRRERPAYEVIVTRAIPKTPDKETKCSLRWD
jgi:phosphopantetheinyl transferase